MTKDFPGEQWKTVQFDFDFTNDFRLDVSNFGRLRTFHKTSNGNIIKGTMTEGYRIVRLKLFRPRDENVQAALDHLQQQVFKLKRKLKSQVNDGESKQVISETNKLLETLKKNVSKKFTQDRKERTIYYHSLVHRLVAEYFLPQPKNNQTIVAHIDHNKLNNRVTNLKWMTPEENYEHQKRSPVVIAEKSQRRDKLQANSKRSKLTVTRVMLLKKLINEGKPMKQLVKLFKITDTQIIRIKRGENWSNVPPAP